MAKVTLTDLTSLANDTSATNSINENFQTLEDYINDNVLSRDTGAETNTMQNDIDMNSYDILNIGKINSLDIDLLGTNLSNQVTYAEAWANTAEDTLVPVAAGGDGSTEYSSRHWAAKTAADAIATAADAVSTAADAVSTAADVVSTNADAASTAADVVAVAASLATVDHIIEYVAASGTSFTPDMSEYANFHFSLTTGANTINNPDDETVGQSGVIVLIQDGTGSGTVSWGTDYEFASGTAPTLSTAASAVDLIPYYVYASGRILCGNILAALS